MRLDSLLFNTMHSRLSKGWLFVCLEDTLSMDSHGHISVPDLEKSAWGKERAVLPPGCAGAVQAPRPSEVPGWGGPAPALRLPCEQLLPSVCPGKSLGTSVEPRGSARTQPPVRSPFFCVVSPLLWRVAYGHVYNLRVPTAWLPRVFITPGAVTHQASHMRERFGQRNRLLRGKQLLPGAPSLRLARPSGAWRSASTLRSPGHHPARGVDTQCSGPKITLKMMWGTETFSKR